MKALCSYPECGWPVSALSLCAGHHYQQKKGKELKPIKRRSAPPVCEVPGCQLARDISKFCRTHWDNLASLGVFA